MERMEPAEQIRRLQKATRIAGLCLLTISLVSLVAYFVMGSVGYLQGENISLRSFLSFGILLFLLVLASLILDSSHDATFIYWTDFLSLLGCIAFTLVFVFYLQPRSDPSSLAFKVFKITSLVSLLPALSSAAFPICHLAKKNYPIWGLLLSYIAELVLDAVALYFSFTLEIPYLYWLLSALIFYRASQYLLLLLTHSFFPRRMDSLSRGL
jgi:hypothetical protein